VAGGGVSRAGDAERSAGGVTGPTGPAGAREELEAREVLPGPPGRGRSWRRGRRRSLAAGVREGRRALGPRSQLPVQRQGCSGGFAAPARSRPAFRCGRGRERPSRAPAHAGAVRMSSCARRSSRARRSSAALRPAAVAGGKGGGRLGASSAAAGISCRPAACSSHLSRGSAGRSSPRVANSNARSSARERR
jgi:hypothetical protein